MLGMLGSLIGGIAAALFGQAASDTAVAFAGSFAFVFAASVIAPSHRQKVRLAAASVVTLLALGIVLSFPMVEEFSRLSSTQKVLTPVAQFLGALYALFISSPVVTPWASLDLLSSEIVKLGGVVAMFGGALTVAGVVIGLLGHGWLSVEVGVGVLFLGAITLVFPFVEVAVRAKRIGPAPEDGGM
jgi:hypothetical protein